jgi:cysteine desulfurase
VLNCCEYLQEKEGFEISYLSVDREGRVNLDDLEASLRADTILVSVMSANNEIGTVQPVAKIGEICRKRGIVFHTDAVQSFGKEPFSGIEQFNADLVSICAHKFHGPKGAGTLYVKSPLLPDPILFGGGHENERRAGTENLVGIIGFVEALERFVKAPVFAAERLQPLTRQLESAVEKIPGVRLVSPQGGRLCNTVSVVVEGSDSIALLAGLDIEGVCASSGSACSAGSLEPSHVISALGIEKNLANSLVRFSLGRDSTMEEVEFAADALADVVKRIRRTAHRVSGSSS